jgi:hypothetical protein
VWSCIVSHRVLVLLLSAIAIPATAQTFGFSLGAPAACLPIGTAMYRLAAPGAPADTIVRIDAAMVPDVRVHLSDTPDDADFVLVDDGETPPACHGASIRSVTIDPAATPDLTVGLTSDAAQADYRIYVRSHRFAPTAAAALLAAAKLGRGRANRAAHDSN